MTELAKKNIKLLGIIFFFGIVVFGGCVFLTLPRPPKEDKLIQHFNDHRTAFEQLRDMLQADTNLCRVARWGVETRKPFFWAIQQKQISQRIVFSNILPCSNKRMDMLVFVPRVTMPRSALSSGDGGLPGIPDTSGFIG